MVDYYISSSTGSDSNTGTSPSSPLKKISTAIAKGLLPGDRVLLYAGSDVDPSDVFVESVSLNSSGLVGQPIVFSIYSGSSSNDSRTGVRPIWVNDGQYVANSRNYNQHFHNGFGRSDSSVSYLENGRFSEVTGGVNTDLAGWTESLGAGASIYQDTTDTPPGELYSCVITSGTSGVTRLQQGVHFSPSQMYEVSFMVRSVNGATAIVDFYELSNGLSNVKSADGVYRTWNGYQSISDLSIDGTESTWTRKTAIIESDSLVHATTLRITVDNNIANGYIVLSKFCVRPLWKKYSGNIWSIGWSVSKSGKSIKMVFDDEHPLPLLNDIESLEKSTEGFYIDISAGSLGNILYVCTKDGGSPEEKGTDITICSGTPTIDFAGNSYISVDNIQLEGGSGFCVDNVGSNSTFEHCLITKITYGVNLTGDFISFNKCRLSSMDYGIRLAPGFNSLTVSNCLFSDALKVYEEGGGVWWTDADSVIVEDCTFVNCTYGVAFQGQSSTATSSNCIIRNNTITDCHIGIWDQSLSNGAVGCKVINNVILSGVSGKYMIQSASIEDGLSYGLVQYRDNNNTLWAGNIVIGVDVGILLTINASQSAFTENCILDTFVASVMVRNSQKVYFDTVNFSRNRYDNNVFIAIDSSNLPARVDFDTWRNTYGKDQNSIMMSPRDPLNANNFNDDSRVLRYITAAKSFSSGKGRTLNRLIANIVD